ncbi:MAG: DUF4924 domain-containing protein [Marinilabiliales bacterium]|nr:MAG: DUF4924 domain-containing protein [Marinilabiliales bacterium]
MIIAEQKKKENIVEYILYIRQIQEILRANKFDINKIEELVINKYDVSDSIKDEIRNWYTDLILAMKQEKIEESGDLELIKILIKNLDYIHDSLLKDPEDFKHKELFRWAEPNIKEYRNLSNADKESDVEVCINAINSLLLLRLKNQAISEETAQAMQTFTNLLANIALHYHQKDVN